MHLQVMDIQQVDLFRLVSVQGAIFQHPKSFCHPLKWWGQRYLVKFHRVDFHRMYESVKALGCQKPHHSTSRNSLMLEI